MKIIICDNERSQLEEIQQRFPELWEQHEVSVCESSDYIFSEVEFESPPDAVLLDIELDGSNGLDVAERLFQESPHTQVIIMTAYTEKFVQDAFLKNAGIIAFLKKPLEREYLYSALEKAEKKISQSRMIFRQKGSITTLEYSNIVYFESMGHIIHIHLDSGESHDITAKLSELFSELPPQFVMCHKSFAVNMEKIRKVDNHNVILQDGNEIPVSRARLADTKARFLEFLADG